VIFGQKAAILMKKMASMSYKNLAGIKNFIFNSLSGNG